jgi:predicted nucleotidyltransferase component of viral defense system
MRRDPRETERAIRDLAAEQGGYFTAGQALAVGYSYRQQHFHRGRGNWLRVGRGLFRLRDFPASRHEDLIRWSLWSRDRKGRIQAVVSHATALSVHELGDVMPRKVHLTVPKGFRKQLPAGLVLHRGHVPDAEREFHTGFRITTPLRTLLDVAESALSPEHLLAAVRDALERGLVRGSRLQRARLSDKGRARLSEALSALSGDRSVRPPRYATPAAFRRALEDRLRERSELQGESLARLRRLVAFDRVLARLFAVEGDAPWIVKGGFGLEVRYRMAARTTKDLDLSAVVEGGAKSSLRERLQEAAERHVGDDFVVTIGSPDSRRRGPKAGPVRFPVEVRLAGRAFARFHLDVGVGDLSPRAAEWIAGEDLLSFADIPPARFAVIRIEQQIAEKLHALTRPRGRTANTRVKDLVDLVLLLERERPVAGTVRRAAAFTFRRHATHPLPEDLPFPPDGWAEPYAALAQEARATARTLPDAHRLLCRFWGDMRRGG